MTLEIVFMRHGRSRADDENVHEGRYDSPLTHIGEAQARARAARWVTAGVRFDMIISSPLLRARRTAEIMAEALGVRVEVDPDWMEFDNRPLAGLAFAVADRDYPAPTFRNPYEPFFGVGESDWEIYCRAARAVEHVVRRGLDRTLVIAHGIILNTAFRTIVGVQPRMNRQGIWFGLGDNGYAHFVYEPGRHEWVLLEFQSGELPAD